MIRNYNDNAAALTWDVLNDEKEIGNWKLVCDNKELNGKGFNEFLTVANSLVQKKQVIYVKNLDWFIEIAQNFMNFKGCDFFANQDLNFYYISISETIELRNWNNFWKKVEDPYDFLKRLDACRNVFKVDCKNTLSFDKHFKFTLARDMWEDVKYKYFLKSAWSSNFVNTLLPQSEEEWEQIQHLDKGSFYFCNSDYFNKKVANVHCYDISSSHLSLLARKKYPSSSFKRAETVDEAIKIIERKFHCWHGLFYFKKLQYKIEDFPIELSRFGYPSEEEMCGWYLVLTNVDMQWFKQMFTWDECHCLDLYYAEQKELCKDYAKMFQELYEDKASQKKGTFAKEIFKFRAELPFGQPIKAVDYYGKTIYNEDTNRFEVVEEKEKTLQEVKFKLSKRGMPMYVSLWCVAYSRLEFFTVLNKIGFDKVVYGDTDSVKFIGNEGIKIIEEHNKTIEEEFKAINKKRAIYMNEKLGKWCDEGDIDYFKSIGIKWYLTSKDDEIEVKAAGAQMDALENWLKESPNPFARFDIRMRCFGLFKNVKCGRGMVSITYVNEMDKTIKKEILKHGTPLYYYNPWEEQK